MNLAPIIFATLVISAFAAMPLKPDGKPDSLRASQEAELLEILSGDFAKASGDGLTVTSLKSPYDAIVYATQYPTHSSLCIDGLACECISCAGRTVASVESTGQSYCYRRDGELQNTGDIAADQVANTDVCDKYWGGSG